MFKECPTCHVRTILCDHKNISKTCEFNWICLDCGFGAGCAPCNCDDCNLNKLYVSRLNKTSHDSFFGSNIREAIAIIKGNASG